MRDSLASVREPVRHARICDERPLDQTPNEAGSVENVSRRDKANYY